MDCIRSSRLMTMIPVLLSSRHVPMFSLIIFRLILTWFPNLNFADCKPLCAVACFSPLRVNVSIRQFLANFLFRIEDFSGYSDCFQLNNLLSYLVKLLLSTDNRRRTGQGTKCKRHRPRKMFIRENKRKRGTAQAKTKKKKENRNEHRCADLDKTRQESLASKSQMRVYRERE